MLAIRQLCIDLQLAPEAEPDLFGRAVQFERSDLLLWGQTSDRSPAEREASTWAIAEINWLCAMLDALRAYYGMLGFPHFETIDGYLSRDPAALSRWYRRLEQVFKQQIHTQFWRLRRGRGRAVDDGTWFVTLYHPRRRAADWMVWEYGRLIDLRFHPTMAGEADELVEILFKTMQRRLVESGFPFLEGLPVQVTYEPGDLGQRSAPLSEFFSDVGIPLFSPDERDPS
jgi:hypothetical protein